MATYVYKPGHPMANENGFLEKSEYLQYEYLNSDDMRMMDGNKPVSVHVISDTMEHTRHMADGKYYSSKHKFRQVTKAHGCIEVGNETKTLLKPREYKMPSRQERRNDIRRVVQELKNRR